MKTYFPYGEQEIRALSENDPAMARAIAEIGRIDREVIPDLFAALINSIAGQQISTKALETVWSRLCERIVPMTPETVARMSIEELQGCGISARKAQYMKGIADEVLNGSLDLSALQGMPDDEVCTRLCALRGVGRWTAEMLLIFSMQRPDVLSCDDLGIQRGLRMLYQHEEITPELFADYRERFSPYGTVAGLYLWAIAAGACPAMHDPKKPSPKPQKSRGKSK